MFYWLREQGQSVLHASVHGRDPKHWHEVIHTLEALARLLAQFCTTLTNIIPVNALRLG